MIRSLFRAAGSVAVGTAAGQAVVLLVTPFLARRYSPADFGSLALLLTVSNVSTALACARFDLALPSARANEAPRLFRASLYSASASALLTLIAVIVVGWSTSATPAPPFESALLVGLCVLLVGTQQAVIGASTRERNYATVGMLRFAQGALFSVFAALPAIGLLVAHVLSFVAALPKALGFWGTTRISAREVGLAMQERREFPLLSLPGALLDVLGYSALIWIVSYFYGPNEAGQYTQIQRLVGAPLMLVGMSVGQVLMRASADMLGERVRLLSLFRQLGWLIAALGSVAVLCVLTVGEPVLAWLLGPGWKVNTAFIVPIALAATVRACVSPLSVLLITLRRFDLAFRWQLLYFVSSSLVLSTAATLVQFGGFIIVYSIHELALYSLYITFIRKAIIGERTDGQAQT